MYTEEEMENVVSVSSTGKRNLESSVLQCKRLPARENVRALPNGSSPKFLWPVCSELVAY
jgi:hypothetical protein